MFNEDKNYRASLVLDFGILWRYVKMIFTRQIIQD